MCENFFPGMPTRAQSNLARRKALFVVLLAVIAAATVYVVIENRPWTVPEKAKQVKNPLQPSDATLKSIRPVYLDKCAVCHGDSGKGDGHDASLYDPAPTNFTDAKRVGVITDGELFYKMSEGHKPMPSFKKRLTEEQRWQLVLLIRSFGALPAQPASAAAANPNFADRR
jgi:mono/diheme cytochrome c family protein